jgi:hypothetical protein
VGLPKAGASLPWADDAEVTQMADYDIPEADGLEQSETVVASPVSEAPSAGPEVPEGDALEQAEPVSGGGSPGLGLSDPEVPEADALEQAHPAPLDEDAEAGDR